MRKSTLFGNFLLILAWLMAGFTLAGLYWTVQGRALPAASQTETPTSLPNTPTAEMPAANLPDFTTDVPTGTILINGIPRSPSLHTILPDHPRFEIFTYTVVQGDTIFGIAEHFNLKPSTVLWANLYVLADDPHNLRPDQVLTILPQDGAYYDWHEKDNLLKVASYFHVTPEDILNYPGNHIDISAIGDFSNPNIPVGTWLIVPNGKRDFLSWSAPLIPRSNPSVARLYGPGACGSVAYGAIGTGFFVWPTDAHYLSGFDYNPGANHPGIDIAGHLGVPIYAADTGVVVYAGWNTHGYGNVIVVDHGNGWQTLYAHLSAFSVGCGDSVYQGKQMASMGSTGNSTGPHLHFEMNYSGSKLNPHDYLP